MKNSEIVEGALELIREKGWTKYECRNDFGFCLIGAALFVQGISDAVLRYNPIIESIGTEAWNSTQHVIRPGLPEGHTLAWRFNDAVITKKEDVEEALTNAAKYWRDRGE